MGLGDVIILALVLLLGGIIWFNGFAYLIRVDRLRMEYNRHAACRWHRWQAAQIGGSLTCTLCGKQSRRINPSRDRDPGTVPFWTGLP